MDVKNLKDKIPNKLLQSFINIAGVLIFFFIVVIIYIVFIHKKDNRIRFAGVERFEIQNLVDPEPTTTTTTSAILKNLLSTTDTIYEKSVKSLFYTNPRLMCNLIPSTNNVCMVNGVKVVKYNFPVSITKIANGSVLAVFNDGRLYQKENMITNIWKGPIENSLPNNTVFLRMISLTPDLKTLLGVGYDNNLYKKDLYNNKDELVFSNIWKKVPNNSGIIFVIFDRNTGNMISIDTKGRIFIKETNDITSKNKLLNVNLDRPILKLIYDSNNYMLAIDDNFKLYQFKEKQWIEGGLNINRGSNESRLLDIMYDNDGKLFGLVINEDTYRVEIMKQSEIYYLSKFYPISIKDIDDSKKSFVINDLDIIKSKNGNVSKYILDQHAENNLDDDINMAYNKQILENKQKLREFCKTRGSTLEAPNYQNYDILSNFENNNTKITELKKIVSELIKYEPNKEQILEQFPDITQ